MPDYNHLRAICESDSRISKAVIDDNMVYYACTRDKVDQEFDRKMSRFGHVAKEMPSNWIGLIKAQFIGHQIFKAGGLISKYLNHSAIKELNPAERDYLRKLANSPWRFSFAIITAKPAADFYEMEDVFTGDTYLLYSPSTSQILRDHPVLLWFNLIAFNGSCWQTFGPVIAFRSFTLDDIFFYATETEPAIESGADLAADIEQNPIRYMILAAGSNYPLIESGGNELVQVCGQGHCGGIDLQVLKKEFTVEYAESVFRLRHAQWSDPPHSTVTYFVEDTGAVLLTGLTDVGYDQMSVLLKRYGLDVPADPDIRIHLPLSTLMEKLFKKPPQLDPYAPLFERARSPEAEAVLAKLNKFMNLALPYINSGKDPDVDDLARQAGVDKALAQNFLATALDKIKAMRK